MAKEVIKEEKRKPLNSNDIADIVAKRLRVRRDDCRLICNEFARTIVQELANGENVRVFRLCTFGTEISKVKVYHDLQSRKMMSMPRRCKPYVQLSPWATHYIRKSYKYPLGFIPYPDGIPKGTTPFVDIYTRRAFGEDVPEEEPAYKDLYGAEAWEPGKGKGKGKKKGEDGKGGGGGV